MSGARGTLVTAGFGGNQSDNNSDSNIKGTASSSVSSLLSNDQPDVVITVLNTVYSSPESGHSSGLAYKIVATDSWQTRHIIRSYLDFKQLSQQLSIHYPAELGSFVLPEVQEPALLSSHLLTNKAEHETLQSFLQHIVNVPVLFQSLEFKEFLAPTRITDTVEDNSSSTSQVETVGPSSFSMLKVLGQGSMGKVLLARKNSSKALYAIKIIRKDWVIRQAEVEHTKAERDILVAVTQARHPFLITMYYSFQTESDLYLVLDYCPGGDLASQLTCRVRLTVPHTVFYTAEIILGIEELHRMGVIYRDLKPENVLIDKQGHVILSDFGLSKQFAHNSPPFTKTFCGTTDYLAPEILRAEPYTFSVDWWSLGCLMYEMLVGVTPFFHKHHQELYRRVLEAKLVFPADMNDVSRSLISQLLDRNPKTRLGSRLHGVNDIKSHAFFGSIDWKRALRRELIPAHTPVLTSDDDVRNFDSEYTAIPVDEEGSAPRPASSSLSQSLQQFRGFSFEAADSVLNPSNEVVSRARRISSHSILSGGSGESIEGRSRSASKGFEGSSPSSVDSFDFSAFRRNVINSNVPDDSIDQTFRKPHSTTPVAVLPRNVSARSDRSIPSPNRIGLQSSQNIRVPESRFSSSSELDRPVVQNSSSEFGFQDNLEEEIEDLILLDQSFSSSPLLEEEEEEEET